MIGDRVAKALYRKGLRSLERGDLDALLRQFDPRAVMTFVGDTSLGADRLTGADLRQWFERFVRLLPERRFDIQRVAVTGPPWNQQLAAHVLIRSSVNGEPYTNQFAHFLRIRWGRVIDDLVLEDTQMWERACHRLAAHGVSEAAAPPLTPAGESLQPVPAV